MEKKIVLRVVLRNWREYEREIMKYGKKERVREREREMNRSKGMNVTD